MKLNQVSELKCGMCHKPTENTTNGLCDKCYIPDDERPSYDYFPSGKTQGRLINIPSSTCAICGDGIYQPMPTGLWEHGDGWYLSDGEKLHEPIPASTLFMLQEDNVGFHRDSNYHDICHIHQKYWNVQLKEKKEFIDRCGYYNEHSATIWFSSDSQRENAMAFKSFFFNKKKNYMKKNPPNPKLYLVFKILHGRRHYSKLEKIDEKIIHDWKTEVPNDNTKIKVKNRTYTVVNSHQENRINSFRNEIVMVLRKK